jgi:colicin import membrane protein
MSTEITLDVQVANPLEAFTTEGGIDPVLSEVRKMVDEFEPDTSTAKGRDEVRSFAAKISKLKTRLDGVGKELTADWKAKSKLVDQSRKQMRDELDHLKVQARSALTAWETAEKTRVIDHEKVIDRIKNLSYGQDEQGNSADLPTLQQYLAELQDIDTDSLEEFELEGRKTKDKGIETLTGKIEAEQQRIEQEAELQALRKEKAEREAEERRAALEAEVAARAKAEAEEATKKERERLEQEKQEAIQREHQAKEAAEQAERDRIAAEDQAKQAAEKAAEEKAKAEEFAKLKAEQAERDRIAAAEQAEKEKIEAAEKARQEEIARQKAEKEAEQAALEKREASKRHIGKIRKEAKLALMEHTDEETAKAIILEIHAGKIPHITINY